MRDIKDFVEHEVLILLPIEHLDGAAVMMEKLLEAEKRAKMYLDERRPGHEGDYKTFIERRMDLVGNPYEVCVRVRRYEPKPAT